MKKLLLASMVAIASVFAIAPASADSVQFGIGIGPSYGDRYYGDDYGPYRHHRYYRPVYDDDYYDRDRYVGRYHHRRHYRDDCRVRIVKHWRHHHRVVERVVICRR